MIEWHLGLTVLKLGNRYRVCQLEMFTNEIAKSFISRQKEQYDNISDDFFHVSTTNNARLQAIFPQLTSLVIFQTTCITNKCRDILLYIVAGGSSMRTFTWRSCGKQINNSKALFDWLFRHSYYLNTYQLTTVIDNTGFELTYEHTLINGYIPHCSLSTLKIALVNLATLQTLLHYLPRLQHLDVHITNVITLTDNTDHLSMTLNYPKELRILKLRNFQVIQHATSFIEQFIEKFSNTLEVFYLYISHIRDDNFIFCFDGHRLATLCNKLLQLRTLSFTIEVCLREKPSNDLIPKFTKTFSTPFWLNGPLGKVQVCVHYNSTYNKIYIKSLPYVLSDHKLFHTFDLINIQFNTNDDNMNIPINLSIALKPLWYNMIYLYLSFDENQQIPLTFLRALQCSFRVQSQTLGLINQRGILPKNAENDVQLTHFTHLHLPSSSNDNTIYDLQILTPWLQLLPNVTCLQIELTELKYWFINEFNNQYLNLFLQRINRLYVNCSSIITRDMNEEIMKPLLLFVINKDRFPQLRCLRFFSCYRILSVWNNVNQWIDFILNHITKHQLTCVRFDFQTKHQEKITELQTNDEVITIIELPYVVHIHRFIWAYHVTLWMEKILK